MTRSEFLKFAHLIAKDRSIAFYGSYAKALGAVMRELYAQGYHKGGRGFQIVEPSYKRRTWSHHRPAGWVAL
jgi:hypothetical protein